MIDGEAVVLGVDGVADFNALHSRRHDDEVQLYAFDILALDADDLRSLPLSMRKTTLLGYWRAGRTASLSRRSNRARSAPTCFVLPATWALKAWYRNGATVGIRAVGRSIGSK